MILTMLASDSFNRHNLPPHQGANRRIRHHRPVNSRLPFNGLAQSELRRIFCSDEGALMRIFQPRLWSPKGLLTSPPFLDRSDAWVAVLPRRFTCQLQKRKTSFTQPTTAADCIRGQRKAVRPRRAIWPRCYRLLQRSLPTQAERFRLLSQSLPSRDASARLCVLRQYVVCGREGQGSGQADP